MLDPALLVGFGEGVVVDDGVPGRIGGEVVGECGTAEDAADVVGILPGVVDEAFTEVREWKAVGGFEDLEGGGFEGGEAWVGLEDFGGALILGFDPGQGFVAVDVFEPLILVGGDAIWGQGWERFGRVRMACVLLWP